MAKEIRNDAQWTRPYYGVSHRFINGRQCTISDYGNGFITATVFGAYGSGCVFSGIIDAPTSFDTTDAAQAWCQQTAR